MLLFSPIHKQALTASELFSQPYENQSAAEIAAQNRFNAQHCPHLFIKGCLFRSIEAGTDAEPLVLIDMHEYYNDPDDTMAELRTDHTVRLLWTPLHNRVRQASINIDNGSIHIDTPQQPYMIDVESAQLDTTAWKHDILSGLHTAINALRADG